MKPTVTFHQRGTLEDFQPDPLFALAFASSCSWRHRSNSSLSSLKTATAGLLRQLDVHGLWDLCFQNGYSMSIYIYICIMMLSKILSRLHGCMLWYRILVDWLVFIYVVTPSCFFRIEDVVIRPLGLMAMSVSIYFWSASTRIAGLGIDLSASWLIRMKG